MSDEEKSLEQLQAEQTLRDKAIEGDKERVALAIKLRQEEEALTRAMDKRQAKREAFAAKDADMRQQELSDHRADLKQLEQKNVLLLDFEAKMEHHEEIAQRRLELEQMMIADQEKEKIC